MFNVHYVHLRPPPSSRSHRSTWKWDKRRFPVRRYINLCSDYSSLILVLKPSHRLLAKSSLHRTGTRVAIMFLHDLSSWNLATLKSLNTPAVLDSLSFPSGRSVRQAVVDRVTWSHHVDMGYHGRAVDSEKSPLAVRVR